MEVHFRDAFKLAGALQNRERFDRILRSASLAALDSHRILRSADPVRGFLAELRIVCIGLEEPVATAPGSVVE